MSEKIYFDADLAYNSEVLYDWYLASVDNSLPLWTDIHIDELLKDFYVIPRDTKPAEVEPVVHAHWSKHEQVLGYRYNCSHCGEDISYDAWGNEKFSDRCPSCGAKMVKPPVPGDDDHPVSGLLDD